MRSIFYCFGCLLLYVSVQAQIPVYKSPITKAAENLVARTQGNHYAKQMFKRMSAQVDPCSNTLCRRGAVLPVKLITFTGERLDEGNVALFWETSEEVNNDHFEVERTLNPSRGYETVANVKGAGTSQTTVKYETNDPNGYTGYTYYRLKQVDIDGTFEYSSIIAIKGGLAPLAVNAFPNPGQSKNIAFKVTGLKVSEQLTVVIYDVSGRVIYQNDNASRTSDQQVFLASLPQVPPGKYSVKITNMERTATGSFVIIP